jgi:hypothetical protein
MNVRHLALAAAGPLFILYPAVRPYGDVTPDGAAAAFASPAWLVAHLAAVAGFVLAGVGLTALRGRVGGFALGTWVAGTALVLPYYGAEAFALHALAVGGAPDVAALAEQVRMGPVQATVFGAGLGLLAVAGVLAAVAAARAALGRWAGVAFALGMTLFLPQFFAEPIVRIAHGVLLGVGCLVLAVALGRGDRAEGAAGRPGRGAPSRASG